MRESVSERGGGMREHSYPLGRPGRRREGEREGGREGGRDRERRRRREGGREEDRERDRRREGGRRAGPAERERRKRGRVGRDEKRGAPTCGLPRLLRALAAAPARPSGSRCLAMVASLSSRPPVLMGEQPADASV